MLKSLGRSALNQLVTAVLITLFLFLIELGTAIVSPSHLSSGGLYNWERGLFSFVGFLLPSYLLYGLAFVLLFRLLMWPFTAWSFRKWQSLKVGFYLLPVVLALLFAWGHGADNGVVSGLQFFFLGVLPVTFLLIQTHQYFHQDGYILLPKRLLLKWAGVAVAAIMLDIAFNAYIDRQERLAEIEQAVYERRPAEWHRDQVGALFQRYDQTDMQRVLNRLGQIASPLDKTSDFVKIDANGAVLNREAKRWSCVWDRTTGLLWQRAPQKIGEYFEIPANYQFGGEGQSALIFNQDSGDVGGLKPEKIRTDRFLTPDDRKANPDDFSLLPEPEKQYDWSDSIATTNQSQPCGQVGWRVPNVLEAMTLLDKSASEFFAFYDKSLWTSSPGVFRNRKIPAGVVVDYEAGSAKVQRAKYRFPVRLMSRDFTPKPPAEIVLLGGGFILDLQTELLWRHCPVQSDDNGQNRCDDGAVMATYAEFIQYREEAIGDSIELDDAGYNEWRLPTPGEFRALYACINGEVSCQVGDKLWPNYDAVKSFEPYTNGLFVTVDRSGDQDKPVLIQLHNNRVIRKNSEGTKGWMKLVRPATVKELALAEKYSVNAKVE